MHTSNKLANPVIHSSLLSKMKEAGGVYCDQRGRPRIVFPWRLSAAEEVGGKSFSSRVQSGTKSVRNSPVSSPPVSLHTAKQIRRIAEGYRVSVQKSEITDFFMGRI